MFNDEMIFVLSIFNLLLIIVFYFVLSLFFKLIYKFDPEEESNPRFEKILGFIDRFHIMKILYLIAAFLLIQVNLEVISETIFNQTLEDIQKFQKLNLLFVSDVIVVLALLGNRISIFDKNKLLEG